MGSQISQQTETTVTFEKVAVQRHIQETRSLKAELVMKSEEIQFLRKRIINDFTEYITHLEEELRKEKSKVWEKTGVIDKYANLCRRLDDKLRTKIVDNEALISENNRLMLELINIKSNPYHFDKFTKNSEEEHEGNDHQEEPPEGSDYISSSSIIEVVKLHEDLDELKSKAGELRKKFLNEGPHQTSKPEVIKFSQQVYDFNLRKDLLHSRGIIDYSNAKPKYKTQLSRNDEKRIDAIGKIDQIEMELQNYSEQLDKDISDVVTSIKQRLTNYNMMLKDDSTFMNSYQDVIQGSDGQQSDTISKSDSYIKLKDYFENNGGDNLGDLANSTKTFTRAISEESES